MECRDRRGMCQSVTQVQVCALVARGGCRVLVVSLVLVGKLRRISAVLTPDPYCKTKHTYRHKLLQVHNVCTHLKHCKRSI